MKKYKVYVLYSETKRVFYVGQTEDLEKRLKCHNKGGSKWTKNKGPWRLVFFEDYETRGEAMKREKYLKTGVGRDYIKTKKSF